MSTFEQVAELSAIMAISTAMIVHPGSSTLSLDSFTECAERAMHVFIVLLVAIYANINVN